MPRAILVSTGVRGCGIAFVLCVGNGAFAQTQPATFTDYYRYDAAGRIVGTISADPDGASGPLPYLASRVKYDADGRLVQTEKGSLGTWQPDSVDPQTWSDFVPFNTTVIIYDVADRKTSTTVKGSDGAIKTFQQYSYDPAGRLQCTAVRMDPTQWTSQTDACVPQTTGPTGPDRIARTLYDAAGQLLTVQMAVGTAIQQDYQSYHYTQNGKQDYVIDANGNKSAYGYDGFDRLTLWYFPSVTAPGAASTTDFEQYGYDANGNRTSVRKRDGRTISYTYDALNRMTVKAFINGGACVSGYACTTPPSSSVRNVYYSYDLRGLQTYARFDSTSGSDTVNQVYDGFGRQTSSTTSMGGYSRAVSYQYDADGNRTRITYPDGHYMAQSFDGLDRESTIFWDGVQQFFSIVFDAQGRRAWADRASGRNAYTYDPVSRLGSDTLSFQTGTSNTVATFGYNPASQIISQSRSNDAYAFSGYSAASNAYAVNGLNQYTAVGAGSLGYDSNGNLASTGGTSFTYDVENRLVSAVGTLGESLTYDPLGRLWQSVGASGTTRFVYDGDQLINEYDGANTMMARYAHGPGEDEPIMWVAGAALDCSNMWFLHPDHQRSIVARADCWGNPVSINSYDEYGVPGAGNVGRFQYTGQTWLPDLGMYYYKARIYSARLGRFLQTDPIGYKDQMDLYAYVGNDPADGRDPSGTTCAVANGVAECKIDQVTEVIDGKATTRNATAEDHKTFAKVEASLTRAANIALNARSNVTVSVGHRSFTIGGKSVAKSLINNIATVHPDEQSNGAMNSPPGEIGIYQSAINPEGPGDHPYMERDFDTTRTRDFLHEGIHNTLEEKLGLGPLYGQLGVEPYKSMHQQGYQAAADALLRQEGNQ